MNSNHYNHVRLIELRKKKGMTQEAVADALDPARKGKNGMTRQTVGRAEKGETASYDLLLKFANLYGVPVGDLIYSKPQSSAA